MFVFIPISTPHGTYGGAFAGQICSRLEVEGIFGCWIDQGWISSATSSLTRWSRCLAGPSVTLAIEPLVLGHHATDVEPLLDTMTSCQSHLGPCPRIGQHSEHPACQSVRIGRRNEVTRCIRDDDLWVASHPRRHDRNSTTPSPRAKSRRFPRSTKVRRTGSPAHQGQVCHLPSRGIARSRRRPVPAPAVRGRPGVARRLRFQTGNRPVRQPRARRHARDIPSPSPGSGEPPSRPARRDSGHDMRIC